MPDLDSFFSLLDNVNWFMLALLYAFGALLKGLPQVPNERVQLWVMAAGAVASPWFIEPLPKAVGLGIIYAWIATGFYENIGWAFESWLRSKLPAKPTIPDYVRRVTSFVFLGFLCLFGSSCAHDSTTFHDATATVKKITPNVRNIVKIAGAVVLDLAIDSEDRVEKATWLSGTSGFLGSVLTGGNLTGAEVEAALGNYLPDKTHWATLAAAIGASIDLVKPYVNEDAETWVFFVGEICLGLKDASEL
jgi:hypothetical protein